MSDEMTIAELREQLNGFGCPYAPEDFRSKIWLEGYRVGFEASHQNAIASLNRLLGKAA